MCEDLSCDFYFGQPFGEISKIKTLPVSFFTTHAELLNNVQIPIVNGYWQKGVLRLLKKYDTYIMLGDIKCFSTWLFMILNALFFHKKICLWGHGWYGRESRSKKILKKLFFSLSDSIMVYGDRAKKMMMQEGINAAKIFTVHNSLDYDRQLEVIEHMPSNNPIQEHFKNHYPTIIFSGRLTARKRIDMLIEAISELRKENIIANCVLIGDGTEKQKLELLVKEHGLSEHFWFYGACYDESIIGSLYWNSTVCVSPEALGLTAIHSLTYGCPVITHNHLAYQGPEVESVIPKITGEFYIYNDFDSLKETIKKWILIPSMDKKIVREKCQAIIKESWTPDYQINVIKQAITY